ncbi:MAG: hypothetical protein L6V88_06910 [Anaerotruncus sp.]|nr:MAG: hypothetical protein L6V88_06910 [Anaerotruncus sp.]
MSSIGTSKNAKRTAFVHLYFNVIGVLLAVILFYGGNAIFKFGFLNESVGAAQIAMIHSVFNVLSTAALLPFTKQLEFLACKTVKTSDKHTAEAPLLDDRFLINPSYAVEKSRELTDTMADLVQNSVSTVFSLVKNYSEEKAAGIKENETKIDRYEEVLDAYLVKNQRNEFNG